MAKDNLTEKAEGCPALCYGTDCYVLGKECGRKDYKHCPVYNRDVRPRGDAAYKAAIDIITSRRPEQA